MKKRVKQPAVTRKTILVAAGTGFAKNGYAATGIGEIAATSGLTRGALFHHFTDKQGLALAWITEELALKVEETCIVPFQSVNGFANWKSGWMELISGLEEDHPAALMNRMGCEWSRNNRLRPAMGMILQQWIDEVQRQLKDGQRDGWIHPSIRPDDESRVLISLACGGSLMAQLTEDPRAAISRASPFR